MPLYLLYAPNLFHNSHNNLQVKAHQRRLLVQREMQLKMASHRNKIIQQMDCSNHLNTLTLDLPRIKAKELCS